TLPQDLPGRLAHAVELPVDLLETLARADADAPVVWRVGTGEPGVTRGAEETGGSAEAGESVAAADQSTAWLPRAGVSVTEQLAVRLRDAIMVSDLRPGDRLSVARCARL